MERNGKGFVFSLDGGASPVSRNSLYTGLQAALKKIGIDGKEMRRRGLSLHSWRHFVNTELLQMGLTIPQVQSVTGHKSNRMTELYNHPDARQINAVIDAQAVIAGTDKPEDGKPSGEAVPAVQGNYSGLKIVKPDHSAGFIRKRA